ncbi:Bug family tripartite tricarboxylate transporter substrate binding protein [Ottowia sp.]|uniref:Bug family tripartite tricarboxylate transporter substrate binding protein n=1 Tax=Ottowia sp. TaxID=1898956 RepID=UPI0039E69D35
MNRRLFAGLLALAPALSTTLPAVAQAPAYPSRPVKIVVPYPAGASPDVVARVLADKLQHSLGQPVIVENKPGASGMIAGEFVARSPADGYTLLISVTGVMAMNPHLYPNAKYDPIKDFRGVSLVLDLPFVLTGSPVKPYTTSLQAFIDAARKEPGKLSYASAGAGSHSHVATEWFSSLAGIRMEHVPYNSAQMTADMVSGLIDVYMDPILTAEPLVKGGKVRALAVTGEKRSPLMPDVPAINEVFPGFVTYAFQGIFAPAATPDAVVQRLSTELTRIIKTPEVQARITGWGYLPIGGSGADLDQRLRRDHELYGRIIREKGIKVN